MAIAHSIRWLKPVKSQNSFEIIWILKGKWMTQEGGVWRSTESSTGDGDNGFIQTGHLPPPALIGHFCHMRWGGTPNLKYKLRAAVK